MALLRQRFPASPVVEEFLACLLSRHTNHPEDPLSGVLQLLEAVPDDIALLALSEAVSLQLPDPATLTQLLSRPRAGTGGQTADPLPLALNQPVPALDVERPLSAYAACLPSPDASVLSPPPAQPTPKEPPQ